MPRPINIIAPLGDNHQGMGAFLRLPLSSGTTYALAVTSTLALSDNGNNGWAIAVNSGIVLLNTVAVDWATPLQSTLNLTDSVALQSVLNESITQNLGLSSFGSNFKGYKYDPATENP